MNARTGILLLIGVALLAIGGLYSVDRYMRYRETEARRFSARDTAAVVRIDLIEKHADTGPRAALPCAAGGALVGQ